MTNSSKHSSTPKGKVAASALLIFPLAYSLYAGFDFLLLAFWIAGAGGVAYSLSGCKENRSKQDPIIENLKTVMQEAEKGVFEQRVTRIDRNHPLGGIAWSLNNLLDQFEALSREVKTSITAISRGQVNRNIYTAGLKGDFKKEGELIDGDCL